MCLVDSLVENQGLELLVKNLERLDEADEEDAQGVHQTMNIIENLTEARPSICTQICECSDILKYLLKRLKVKKFDRNKLYCSEILSILTQADAENKKRIGTLTKPDGVDLLLQIAAYYRRRDPQNLEEAECVQNVFSCLANVVLDVPENQTKFRHSEGLELMIRCMREQKYARTCAIKVLDFALDKSPSNCERFIQQNGLKAMFPAFMGKGLKGKGKSKSDIDKKTLEEHTVNIVYSLCTHTKIMERSDGTPADPKSRLLAKFKENEFEKAPLPPLPSPHTHRTPARSVIDSKHHDFSSNC
jgi:beta-catenin-like protein 1